MIKKIPLAELKPGMYVHDLDCSWRVEPIFPTRFKVVDEARIEAVRELGVREVYIDTVLGDDLPGAPSEAEVKLKLEGEMERLAGLGEIPVHYRLASRDELGEAMRVHDNASGIIRGMMADVRLGRQVEQESVMEALNRVNDTALGNFGTLVQLGQLKNKDDYTFQHSVSVCALLTAFGQVLKLNRRTIADVGIGALLHDIGKTRVPMAILNKPGRLTETEFDEIKLHVTHGEAVLKEAGWIGATALQVMGQHHERYDGSGYPRRLKGTDISPVGQMAAIVDVYDAITADRVYHQAMMPVEALRKLREWSRYHFNEELVGHFIRSLGIYPVRTVVRLESRRVGIVVEQTPDNLARPVLLLVYDETQQARLAPQRYDLAKSDADRIVAYESPEKYDLDVDSCLAAA